MKKLLFTEVFLVLLVILACDVTSDPEQNKDNTTKRPLQDEHELFIATFYPMVQAENLFILRQREHLMWLRERHLLALHLGNHLLWMNRVSSQYRFDSSYFHQTLSKADFEYRIDSLLIHIDIIPEKLVMAQAALESGWGNSYLARNANNYFGMRCFRRGCGIAPYGDHSQDFWHRTYPTVADGVKDYMFNLNTANAYKKLRKSRWQQRIVGLEPDPFELANTLDNYSEMGRDYIRMLNEVMNNYLPPDLAKFADSVRTE